MTTTVARKKQCQILKKRYTQQTAIGFPLLIISLVLLPASGGINTFIKELHLYFQAEQVIGRFTTTQGNQYTKTGTDVAFNLWNVEYEFTTNGQQYQGQGTIDYPPHATTTVLIYYIPQDPAQNSLKIPALSRLIIYTAVTISLVFACIFLISGYRNYRLFENFEY